MSAGRREYAIRASLGAGPKALGRLVLGRGLLLSLPGLVVGTFLLFLMSVSPLERGNARLVRLLAGHLLRRAGYGSIPYASLERQMEELRESYHDAVDRAQTRLWSGEADLEPWLRFLFDVLGRQAERVEQRLLSVTETSGLAPLQRAILATVRRHESAAAGLLLEATGANRNTLKDNLRKLVDAGLLEPERLDVRPAAGGDQDLIGNRPLAVSIALVFEDSLITGAPRRQQLRAELQADAVAHHGALDHRRRIAILARQELWTAIDQRHLAAETGEGLR